MKLPLLLLAITVPTSIHAQAFQPYRNDNVGDDRFRGLDANTNPFRPYDAGDTPTMRRQKLRWALELRDETQRLLDEDGGTLTPHHQYYVRREVRRILTGVR